VAAKESNSITYYVGLINIGLVIVWVLLYGFGILRDNSINSPTATPFYVGTLFAVGFGIVFPFFEKTMSGKLKINQGLTGSLIALGVYAAMIAVYLTRGSLMILDLRKVFGA
jgi:hypothetical protein